jgi:uncharacterized membrane protein
VSDSYLVLKGLHVLGMVIFLGNIIITGWWKVMADRTRDPRIVAFAQRQVTLTDFVFTGGGVVLILATGLGNAVLHHMDYWHIRWLAWGLGLFIASGVIWATILVPVQIKQARLARGFAQGGEIPESYWRLARTWNIFGAIATLLPLLNLYWMVFKPL